MTRSFLSRLKDRVGRSVTTDPQFVTDIASQRARLLDAALAGVVAAEVFFVLLLVLVRQDVLRPLAVNSSAIVALLCLRTVARRGREVLASAGALGGMAFVVSWTAWAEGGVRAPSVAAFPIVVLCAGLLFGVQGAIVGGLVVSTISLGFVVLGQIGALPAPVPPTDLAAWAIHVSYAIITVFLVGLVTRHQRDTLRRARLETAERQKADEAQRQSEERLGALIAGVSDIVTVHDRNGVVLYESPSADRLLGFGPDGLVGRSAFEFVHPEDLPIVRAAFEKVATEGSTGVPTGFRLLRANGEALHVESVGRGLLDSPSRGIVLVTRDVRERRRAEAETERWLAETSLVSTVAGLTLEIDEEEALLAAVERALRGRYRESCGVIPASSGGRLPPEAEGFLCRGGGSPEGPARLVVAGRPGEDAGLLDPAARSALFVPLRAGGGLVGLLVLESAEPRAYGGDDVRLLSIVASQVATAIERIRILRAHEATIAELETRNAELERFSYTVSHDLKSPLTTIKGFIGYIEASAREGRWDRVRQDVARIESAADRMHALLDDLLELSRVGRVSNEPTTFPFGGAVTEALELVAGRLSTSKARVAVQEHLPDVTADRSRIVEVVQNLVDNAVKFSSGCSEPFVEIGCRRVGGGCVFFVRDNGIGIEPRYHERVFGLFDKLDPRGDGTGVGLALVRRIIELHGGRVWVESAGAGQGTSLCFTLPSPSVECSAEPDVERR